MSDTPKVERRATPWPPESLCYKCSNPVGSPWSERIIPRRPVCPVCALENIRAALGDEETES